jgi:hypothetical protein
MVLSYSVHSRELNMTQSWYKSYKVAILETDWTTMPQRLRSAELKIVERQRILSLDHGGSPQERQSIADALRGIRQIRIDVSDWEIFQSLHRVN